MKEFLFKNVEKLYKKAFKKHHDSLYKTIQSKPVIIDEQPYVLIGEERLLEFPLVSHFDVFDIAGNSASEEVGKDIHNFFSYMILVDLLRPVEHALEQQEDTGNSNILGKLQELFEQVNTLMKKDRISTEEMHALNDGWDSFWNVYEPRANWLIETYDTIQQQESASVKEEAQRIKHIFQSLSFSKTRIENVSIHTLVEQNYIHGRLRKQDPPLEAFKKGERTIYTFFTYIYRVFIAIVLLIIVVLMSENELTFGEVVGMLIPVGLGFVIKQQSNTRLLTKNDTHLSEFREKKIQEEKLLTSDARVQRPTLQQQDTKIEEDYEPSIMYETYGIMMNNLLFPAMFAMISFGVGIALYFDEDGGINDALIAALIGLVFVGVTILLPLTPLAKQRFKITDRAIHLRKEQLSNREVVRVVLKENGKSIHIFVNYHDSPFKVRLMPKDEVEIVPALQSWCAINQIPFENKAARNG